MNELQKATKLAEQPARTLEELYALSREVSAEQRAQLEERSAEYWASKYPVPLEYELVKKQPAQQEPQEFVCSTGLCPYRKPLTDEQIGELKGGYQSGRIGSFVELIRAIESKLKERNT